MADLPEWPPASVPFSKVAVLREVLDPTSDRFGAVGDGIADDTAGLLAAIAVMPSLTGGAVPSGGMVLPPRRKFRTSAPLVLGSGGRIVGAGDDATVIQALPAFAGGAMITNAHTDGTQQSAHVENINIDGNSGAGAVVPAGILFDSLFVATSIRRVKANHCSGNGIKCQSSMVGANFGLAVLDTITAYNNGADQILLDGAYVSLDLHNLDVEHMAAGFHGLHLRNNGTKAGWRTNISNLYSENNQAGAASVLIEGHSAVLIDGLEMGGVSSNRTAADGVTNATTTFTSASAAFTAADVNSVIRIVGAGPGGADFIGRITARTDATTVTLDRAPSNSLAGRTFTVIGQAAVRIVGASQWATGTQAGAKGIEVRNVYSIHTDACMVDDQTRNRIVLPGGSPTTMARYRTEAGYAVAAEPPVPATGEIVVNPYGQDAEVTITAGAAAPVARQVELTNTPGTYVTQSNQAGSTVNTFTWPAGAKMKFVMGGAFTWHWALQ